jgi:NAD+ diphosphatase
MPQDGPERPVGGRAGVTCAGAGDAARVNSHPLQSLALARGTVDRAAHRRTDDAWLEDRWNDRSTRVLVVDDGTAAVTGDPPALLLSAPGGVPPTDWAHRWFLGLDADGTALFVVPAPVDPRRGAATLREVGALLSDRDAGLLTTAVALEAWHATHGHCPRCGSPTEVADAGMLRVCTRDGSLQHPRVDPAVIMAVVDGDGRLLLGHQARWPARRFSTLAGFVEPGESLEQAVAREVREETGIVVSGTTYLGSQPWPFPRSLMLGFFAEAASTEITTDDVEIVDARWFTHATLADDIAVGEVVLPPRVSIARRLIERWYGGRLDAPSAHRDG